MSTHSCMIRLFLVIFLTCTYQAFPGENRRETASPGLVNATRNAAVPAIIGRVEEPSPRDGTIARAAYDGNNRLLRNLIREGHAIEELDNNGKTPLQEAICRGHEETAGILLDHGSIHASIDKFSRQGLTALHYAVEKQQLSIINRLLLKGSSINKQIIVDDLVKMTFGATALHLAAKVGNPQVADLLLKKGAHADLPDGRGRIPLHDAAYYNVEGSGHLAVAAQLIRHNRSVIDKEDNYGASPLMRAVISDTINNLDIVDLLINEGADINKNTYQYSHVVDGNKVTVRGVTPLMRAIVKSNAELVHKLIGYKASINAKNDANTTALDFAISTRNDAMQRILLFYGAEPVVPRNYILQRNAYWVLYPLHEAADAGNLKRVKMFAGDSIGVNHLDHEGRTPLHYACKNGHLDAVSFLVSKMGATSDELDQHGKTPMHYAIEQGQQEVVEYLVRHKAKLTQDTQVSSYLDCAAKNRHELIVVALLNAGAQIDNPLHWAVRNNLEKAAQFLANKEDLVARQDQEHKTALHRAIESDSLPLTKILVQAGSALNVTDGQGRTPMDYSALKPNIRELLENLTNIDRIVEQHRAESEQDLKNTNEVRDLQQAKIQNLCMQGMIKHSLSQKRLKCESNLYCAYYALFNAVSCLNPTQGFTRNHFVDFFRQSLQTIKTAGGNPPYDNLSTKQLRHLVKTHYEGLPIAIIEMNNLFCYLQDILKTPEEAFEIEDHERDLIYLQRFLNEEDDNIAILAGSGIQNGHWICIYAQRNAGKISIKVFDSYSTLDEWDKCPLKKIDELNLLILYQMITHPVESWKKVISADLLIELDKLRMAYSLPVDPWKSDPTALIEAFENFIESLNCMKNSVEMISRVIDSEGATPDNVRVLHALRFEVFLLATQRLSRELGKDNLKRGFEDPLNKDILGLNLVLCDGKYQQFINQLGLIAGLSGADRALVQIKIQEFADRALELKNKLVTKPDSMTSGNFYDAPTLPIEGSRLEFIRQYLQPEIKSLIEDLNQGLPGVKTVLFYGPPGNGKTTIAQALAQLCPCASEDKKLMTRPFRIMRVPALGTKYQHSKAQQISSLYQFIEKNPGAVILLDEIDALSDSKCDQDESAQVLQTLIDHERDRNANVVFIGTTNSDIYGTNENAETNKKIASPLISRFESNIIKIDNPNIEHRRAIIENCILGLKNKRGIVSLTIQDKESLAKKTVGFSIRDLEALFSLAYRNALLVGAALVSGGIRQITKEHVDRAFEVIKKGKVVSYWPMISTCLKNVALHGSPWLGLAQSVFSMYIQEFHNNSGKIEAENQRFWDKWEARGWQLAGLGMQCASMKFGDGVSVNASLE